MSARSPAPRPCDSCPYRLDTPSGVWAESEYRNLAEYDRPTGEQPTAVFLCHQRDARVCAGWAGCHDTDELLALRMAPHWGVSDEVVRAVRAYRSPVPLHPSGTAACAHGLAELDEPGPDADRLRRKLFRQHPTITIGD